MLIEIALCIVIAFQSVLHYIERERLCDRIMSKNLNEYKAKDEPKRQIQSAHDKVLRRWRGSDD